MEWASETSFHESEEYTWVVDGEEVGRTQKGGGLTWATVEGAGELILRAFLCKEFVLTENTASNQSLQDTW